MHVGDSLDVAVLLGETALSALALPPLGQRGLKVDKRRTGGPYPVRFKEL